MLRSVIAILACVVVAQALTVHIVPHTHDDVGWLKTVDQYYQGANNSIQHAGVQYIIDSVIQALLANPERKFVYVEQAFFQRWWRQQTDSLQAQVKQLVKNGQLEFINGGWCMHDEAAAHYVDMVDQTTLGHAFLMDQFGVQPTIGWQIDPFGHSATQAALLSYEVGFDGLFFARSDYQDMANRQPKKEMEVIWRASPSLGAQAQVFTGAFVGGFGYGPPSGFDWDLQSDNERIQDDPALEDYNLDYWVDKFEKSAMQQAASTLGENVMWTMGSDFNHENSNSWFKELDKIIKGVNAHGVVSAIYSTPSIYVKAKNAENLQWPVKTDDYFPYADGDNNYWTGYFTSRPALKRYIRMGSAFLQIARQMEIFTGNAFGNISLPLWMAQGVTQHHDSVSGTSKQHVAYDYAKRVSVGSGIADGLVEPALASKTIEGQSGTAPILSYCPLANISVCSITQSANGNLVVLLYNPIARERTELVRIPVNTSSWAVVDSNNAAVPSDVLKTFESNANKPGFAPFTISFIATVNGLGFNSYFLTPTKNTVSVPTITPKRRSLLETNPAQNNYLDNGVWRIDFDSSTNLITTVTDIATKAAYPFSQTFWYYASYQGNSQHSGAYIFRPNDSSSVDVAIPLSGSVQLTLVNGAVVKEARMIFNDWIHQTVRLVEGHRHIEFEYTVGDIPIGDNQGKEIITRFSSNIASQQGWYTDSNGREFLYRKLNYRPTWNLTVHQPVAGNYYPANIGAGLDDGTTAMVVLNDRSQGCASLHDGELEFMVHRRLLMDDGRGVSEPLNETDSITGADGTRIGKGLVITGSHYLFFGSVQNISEMTRPFANRVFQPLHQTYGQIGAVMDYVKNHNVVWTALGTPLPINVELMTAQIWMDNTILIRLSHQFGINESKKYSQDVTVDLANLFTVPISTVVELSLTANQPAGAHKYYTWNTTESKSDNWVKRERIPAQSTKVTLSALQIGTYQVSG